MAKGLVKRFIKKDGSQRISFYQDEYAGNPRYETDFPLHCEDWSWDYSIMTKHDRETRSEDARKLLEYLILTGDNCNREKFINTLIDNGKKIGNDKVEFGSALVYDRSRRGYILYETSSHYWSTKAENGWYENGFYDGKKDDIALCIIIGDVQDEAIDWCAQNCMTDKVKIMSYGFGYYGGISFYRDFSTDSEGIAWLEKDEALKDWIKEEYWEKEDCYDLCDGIRNELEAWAKGEVYGFVVEDAVRIQGIKTYYNGEREDESYIDTQWEQSDSCWGYYGDIDKVTIPMFDEADLDINEFEEVEI